MATIIDTIRQRLTDAEGRVERLRAEFEKAVADKKDLETALRVLGDVGVDEISAPRPAVKRSRPASEKKQLMLNVLNVGESQGKAPIEVFNELAASGADDINIGVVRTTLWRAADAGEISSADGKYWKHEAEDPLFSETPAHSSSAEMTSGGTQPNDHASDRGASHDALFGPERGGGT